MSVRRPVLWMIALAAVICALILWWGCAGQVPPDGGPKDETPPRIIGVYPEPNSTGVDTDVIRFRFNKFVDQRSFRQALFISPMLDDIEIKWRGREVSIHLYETLRDNTTYSITVGTDVRDIREGNRLSESFTLAFSTGPEIDTGIIEGKVYYHDPVGILIFAYRLENTVAGDTLDPQKQRPDYITQSGNDGIFHLPFIGYGKYRIIAVLDEFQNRLYDPETDPYGVYRRDIAISEEYPAMRDINIRMKKPDLTKPYVSRASSLHNSKISLRFSKPVDPTRITGQSFTLSESTTGEKLRVHSFAVRGGDPSEIYIFTEPMTKAEYKLTADSMITDLHGNKIRSDERTAVFEGTAEPPEKNVIVEFIHPGPGQRDVPPDMKVTLQFSAPVRGEEAERAIKVVDTSQVAVAGDIKWRDSATAVFTPARPYESRMQYSVIVELDSLPQTDGFRYVDSLYVSKFTVTDRDKLGAVSGEVLSEDNGGYTVKAEKIGSGESDKEFSQSLRGGGPFVLQNMPEFDYRVWAFEDQDLSGKYDYGEVFPFRGSALFTVYTESVTVRARWTVDGIILDMREH